MKSELISLDATAQAELVRRGELTAIELVDAAIDRIESLNPQLNAVIAKTYDKARQRAQSKDLAGGPFRGVPFLLKDLGAHSAGDPFHVGMRVLKEVNWTEPHDSYVARRFQAAGFIILGKTNTPELGLLPTTEPESYGPTRNPWDPTRSAGGSSGGAASAVAARMVPAAHATDGGGSIRIPAAHCGLVGLKPSRGRVSMGPFTSEGWGGLSVQNSVTLSVRDSAAILDVLTGAMPGDPYTAPTPLRPYVEEIDSGGKLRIGMVTSPPSAAAVHRDCVAAVEQAAHVLAGIGHHVEAAHPQEFLDPQIGRAVAVVIGCSALRAIGVWGEKIGRKLTEADVEPATWAFAEVSQHLSGADYAGAIDQCHRKARELSTWWESGFDLLLTPTATAPPPPIGYFKCEGEPFQTLARAATFSAFTSIFNATGQPAISLPVHWNAEGLPIGVQLVAAYGREDLLVRAAAQLEAELQWARRLAPHHAV